MKAATKLHNRNPDVLTCIANLSNDEVFTPPHLANEILDAIDVAWSGSHGGASIWTDPTVRFLDPFAKSGVFLREITRRLVEGLVGVIPDLQNRVDHVLTHQVFGVAITELTSLLSRRSLYCSKWADSSHSICRSFSNDQGNVWFGHTDHSWTGSKCRFCGAPKAIFNRPEGAEMHAYAFIHAKDVKNFVGDIFGTDMKFDVIIGNPPYQMTGGAGGTNDSPLYHLFIEQAKRLEPRLLAMVIPSRWMAGGRGLDEFRLKMLGDKQVRVLVDYENAKDLFPTIGIIGGACYFLWEHGNPGKCLCTYHRNGLTLGPVERDLSQFDVLVRDPRAVSILEKVVARAESTVDSIVSGDTPFGLATNFKDYRRGTEPGLTELRLYANNGTTRVQGAVARVAIAKNTHLIDFWKLLLPVAGSGRERERSGVDIVLGPSIVSEPGSVCTQTYLVAGPLDSRVAAESLASYLQTRFARLLISLRKPSQHVFKNMYKWLPMQTWDRNWSDDELYEKYSITAGEVEYIESLIRPMDSNE